MESSNINTAIQGVLDLLCRKFNAESGGIMFLENDKLRLQKPAFKLQNDTLINKYVVSPSGEGNAARVFRENRPYLSNRAHGDFKIIQYFVQLYGVNSLMTVPLCSRGKNVGVLQLIISTGRLWNTEMLSHLHHKVSYLSPLLGMVNYYMEEESFYHLFRSLFFNAERTTDLSYFMSNFEKMTGFMPAILDRNYSVIYNAIGDIDLELLNEDKKNTSTHFLPLDFRDRFLGYLVLSPKMNEMSKWQESLVEQSGKWLKIVSWKLYERTSEVLSRNLQQYMLETLLECDDDSVEEKTLLLDFAGLDRNESFRVLVTSPDAEDSVRKKLDERNINCVVGQKMVDHKKSFAVAVAKEEKEFDWSELLKGFEDPVGASSLLGGIKEVKRGFEEAEKAFSYGKHFGCRFVYYSDVDLHSVFIEISENKQLQRFSRQVLQPLEEYDINNKTQLIKTLEEFFNSGTNQRQTAKELFIHLNTLRYRLELVKKLTGLNPGDFNDQFKLKMALSIGRLSKRN